MLRSCPETSDTVAPRIRFVRPGSRSRIEAALAERFRYRNENGHIEIDFATSNAEAKTRIIAALNEIDPAWHRIHVLYPRDWRAFRFLVRSRALLGSWRHESLQPLLTAAATGFVRNQWPTPTSRS